MLESTYIKKTFLAGRSKDGLQLHRDISISTTPVEVHYDQIMTKIKVWEEEDEDGRVPYHMEDRLVRPDMTVCTIVTRSKNRFGLIKLYGVQGL